MPPEREWDLEGHVSEISEQRQRLVRCETLLAQSIVFHALDYAESLGFPPHRDFEPALFEPRPEALLETPWCLPERPYYVAGPSDDVPRTLLQLLRIVDYDFDYVIPEYLMPAWFVADDDGDDDYDDDHDYDDDFEDDEEARIDPDADRPHSDRQAQAPAASGEIDWARACQGVPVDDLFEGIDLGEDFGLEQAVQTLESALENGSLLQWEAIIRNEQGLGCTEAHEDALDELLSFANEEREDERILWIDEIARPAEPWYASVRRLAPLLVVERFETWQSYPDDFETRGVRLLEAISAHAEHLSLPAGCERPEDVVPAELRHHFRVQAIFDTLGGLGQAFGGKKPSLAEKPDRIAAFAEALASVTDSMLALGWKLDDLFNVLILPDADREVLMNALVTRTARTAGGGARQAAVSKSQGSS